MTETMASVLSDPRIAQLEASGLSRHEALETRLREVRQELEVMRKRFSAGEA
jgi:hypothetical protein